MSSYVINDVLDQDGFSLRGRAVEKKQSLPRGGRISSAWWRDVVQRLVALAGEGAGLYVVDPAQEADKELGKALDLMDEPNNTKRSTSALKTLGL